MLVDVTLTVQKSRVATPPLGDFGDWVMSLFDNDRGPPICLGAHIVTAYKNLPRAHCGPVICLDAHAQHRGRLSNAHVSARCHEPGSDGEEHSRHGGGAPPPKNKSKKRDFRKKQGAVGGRRVHVGKVKCRDQHRAEQARFALHVQLCSSPSEPGSWQWAKCKQKTEHKCAVCHSIFNVCARALCNRVWLHEVRARATEVGDRRGFCETCNPITSSQIVCWSRDL